MTCPPNLEYALMYLHHSKDLHPNEEPSMPSFKTAREELVLRGEDIFANVQVDFFQYELFKERAAQYGRLQRAFRGLQFFVDIPPEVVLATPSIDSRRVFRDLRRHVMGCVPCKKHYELFLVEQARPKAIVDGFVDVRQYAFLYRREDADLLNVLSDTSFHFEFDEFVHLNRVLQR